MALPAWPMTLPTCLSGTEVERDSCVSLLLSGDLMDVLGWRIEEKTVQISQQAYNTVAWT